MGGLDLCYGRMDNKHHLLVDSRPPHYWNGIDYSNARYRDFHHVDKLWNQDIIERDKIPRMPWHDVALKVEGKAAFDIGIHFIELWNHVMTDMVGDLRRTKNLLQPVERRATTR
jgi:phospholipase D1/2